MSGYSVETPADLITRVPPRSSNPALFLPLLLFLFFFARMFFFLFLAPPFFFSEQSGIS